MAAKNYILITELCTHYKIDIEFVDDLHEYGLLHLETIETQRYLPMERIADLERIIRLRNDLKLNYEGIDVVVNLLERLESLEIELSSLRNKLNQYKIHQN